MRIRLVVFGMKRLKKVLFDLPDPVQRGSHASRQPAQNAKEYAMEGETSKISHA
jgi:hypothetical protein